MLIKNDSVFCFLFFTKFSFYSFYSLLLFFNHFSTDSNTAGVKPKEEPLEFFIWGFYILEHTEQPGKLLLTSHVLFSPFPSPAPWISLRRDVSVVVSLIDVSTSLSVTDRPWLAEPNSESSSSLFRDNRSDDWMCVGGSGAPCLLWPSWKSDAALPSGGADTEDVGEKRPLGEKQLIICKLKPLRVRNIDSDSHHGCALWHPANLPSQSNDEYQLL